MATPTVATAPQSSAPSPPAGNGACTIYTEPHNNISICRPASWYAQPQVPGAPTEEDLSLQQQAVPTNSDTVALRFITDPTTQGACLTSNFPGGPQIGVAPYNVGPAVGVVYTTEPPSGGDRIYGYGSNQWLGGRCARLWFMYGTSSLRDSHHDLATSVINSVTFN